MTALRILSGGAAQGLVASLAPQFKALAGLDIDGEFGAVGTMAGKPGAGNPAGPPAAAGTGIGGLGREGLGVRGARRNIRLGANGSVPPGRGAAGFGTDCFSPT